MRPSIAPTAAAAAVLLACGEARSQTSFGTGCAGASGVTPELAVSGPVEGGRTYTLTVTAPGGIGLGYLLIGFSNASASSLGGAPLPLDLGTFFADPLWNGCSLAVDPSFALVPFLFDPFTSGGAATFDLPGFDAGTVFFQALNVDPDFATRIAGVSRGLVVASSAFAPDGFVLVPPGTFRMGSTAPGGAPYFGGPTEQPVRDVTVGRHFWIAEHEVTQAQYEALMGVNPSLFVGPDLPVERVTYEDARAYCRALTLQAALAGGLPRGYQYRLPTEAEWEYACRAGTTTEFAFGPELDCADAQIFVSQHSGASCGSAATVPVKSFAPNAFGLYDVHGNVWEWCLDTFAPYAPGPATDPLVDGPGSKVIRGGGWSSDSNFCRSAARSGVAATTVSQTFGFRVVLAPSVEPEFEGLVRVDPGTFQMGSSAAGGPPYFTRGAEQPVHAVTIGRTFWMGAREVTQAEYESVMGVNPSQVEGASLPVDGVSWTDARAYCAALTTAAAAAGTLPDGYVYRLPTEAEWEYACRAGLGTEFGVGSGLALGCADARFGFSTHSGSSCGATGSVAAGSYAPNAWGLFDMHGNVGEWCLDAYAPYGPDPVSDPFVADGPQRVVRGGNWSSPSYNCRSSSRLATDPAASGATVGFRVVLAPRVELDYVLPGFVPIFPGTFQMGSNAPDVAPYFSGAAEKPVRTVTISQPFWLGRYEVTQGEYEALMGTNPSPDVGANLPVAPVSWAEAVAYCQALTAQQAALGNLPEGYEYRLPTEAEWEYACRAGTTTEFAVGNGTALFCSDARFLFSNHSATTCSNPAGPSPVGSYPPNAWGLYDMHGNVREWCLDTYAPYTAGPVTDPFVTGGIFPVFRGGSLASESSSCRSAFRVEFLLPGIESGRQGFRVALAPVIVR